MKRKYPYRPRQNSPLKPGDHGYAHPDRTISEEEAARRAKAFVMKHHGRTLRELAKL